jgi:THAP4-like, heme-binding beta-barrel domain
MTEMLPALGSLACLLGTWRGEGHGGYPTIGEFHYGEWMHFEHVGDPFLMSAQRSWLIIDEAPLHFERGFWRPGAAAAGIELTLAHPLGLTEVAQGTTGVDGEVTTIDLVSHAIGRTTTGMAVSGLRRRYEIEGDSMRYEIDMATDATPMTRHLMATLRLAPA